MHAGNVTTPHGRRTVDIAQLRRQAGNSRDLSMSAKTVNKWQVFRDVCAARQQLGLRDRALAVLNALLSFYPETELSEKGLVVFPSNSQLSARANGIAGATLRRALAALVDAGLIERHDSPNGKRYARRDGAGEIARAFGFALTPLITRASDIASLAARAIEEARQFRQARETLSIARRDVRKLIVAAEEDGADGDWEAMARSYHAIVAALPRTPDPKDIEVALTAMTALRENVLKALDLNDKTPNMSVNDAPVEQHLEDSPTDNHIEQEKLSDGLNTEIAAPEPARQMAAPTHVPLDMVLQACPHIVAYATGQDVRSWRDLLPAAALASSMLGISRAAWQEAYEVMGPENAATGIAYILERHEQIKSPGGYLRNLTLKARAEQYEPVEMIMSLLGARGRSQGRARRLMN